MKDSALAKEYKGKFHVLSTVAGIYGLPIDTIAQNVEEIDGFKVTVPLVGGFSTGKSTLLNALVGKAILPVDITPETALPTEILYGKNGVSIRQEGQWKEITFEELRNQEYEEKTTDLVQVRLEEPFFESIKTVKIVDMPGFDSGIEMHNRVINDYLPNSLAYVLVFSADEPVLKESILNFLQEFKVYEMPLYVVVTKSDKVVGEAVERAREFLRKEVAKRLGVMDVPLVPVSSLEEPDVPGLKTILQSIQEEAEEHFIRYFKVRVGHQAKDLESYLLTRLRNADLTMSELVEMIGKLENEITHVNRKMAQEKESFDKQVNHCIGAVVQRIESDLQAAAGSLESMIVNGQDIKASVTMIVRNSVAAGVRSELEPKLQRYLKNIAQLLDVGLLSELNVGVKDLQSSGQDVINLLGPTILPVTVAVRNLVAAIPVIAVLGPLLAPIALLLGTIFQIFAGRAARERKEEEQRMQVRAKIQGEMIPGILREAHTQVAGELYSYLATVHEEIEKSMRAQQSILTKSLEDIRQQKYLEDKQSEEEKVALERDLERVRSVL